MPSKACYFILLGVFLGVHHAAAAELGTLFTTAAEREIIDSNRYKSVVVENPLPQPELPVVEDVEEQETLEEVILEYVVSGITLSSEGTHIVWINSVAYEDGEVMDDDSRVRVLTDDEIRVRITAPDGQDYYATSGQTLEVTYLAPAGNQ